MSQIKFSQASDRAAMVLVLQWLAIRRFHVNIVIVLKEELTLLKQSLLSKTMWCQ